MGKSKAKNHSNNIYRFTDDAQTKQSEYTIFSMVSSLVSFLLMIINYFLIFINYGMLIYQTVLVINDQNKRLFNLRQIILKWILVVLVFSLFSSIGPSLYFENIVNLASNIIQFIVIYPTEVWKSFLIKYFVKNRNLEEGGLKHFGAIAVSKIVYLITDLILFIHPKDRQPIYQACAKLQNVLQKEQYLWNDHSKQQNINIYNLNYSRNYRNNQYLKKKVQQNSFADSNANSFLQQIPLAKNDSNKKTMSQKMNEEFLEMPIGPSPIKKRNITISLHENSESKEFIEIPKTPTSTITAMVSQMIQIMPPTKYAKPSTRFAFYRELMVSYNPILAEMKLTILSTNKIVEGQLIEAGHIDNDILQIKLSDQQVYFLKFLSEQQCCAFINAIEKGEQKWSKIV